MIKLTTNLFYVLLNYAVKFGENRKTFGPSPHIESPSAAKNIYIMMNFDMNE